MDNKITLSQLYYYPVKSLAGLCVANAKLGVRGIAYDRHWMLIDEQGRFLSQRKLPKMACISTEFDGYTLNLRLPNGSSLSCSIEDQSGELTSVTIWQDTCQAMTVSECMNQWLSHFLKVQCQLVFLPLNQRRQVDLNYAKAGDQTGFADGFPLLLISQASLDGLNRRLPDAVSMSRFRPNLVVSGCLPHEEDEWQSIEIGGMTFDLVKPCSRCIITTINPLTGIKGKEPLATLSQYRRLENQVMFGQNVLHHGVGNMSVGMPVRILR